MYSVVVIAGQQHKVTVGDRIKVNLPPDDTSEQVGFNRVLMFHSGTEISVGRPVLEGAIVKAQVLKRAKDKKVVVFKFERTEGYKRTVGHRQPFTELLITEISFGNHRETYVAHVPKPKTEAVEAAVTTAPGVSAAVKAPKKAKQGA